MATTKRKPKPTGSPKKAPARAVKKTAPAQAKSSAPKRHGPRANLGAPIDSFFRKQPPHLRALVDELRQLIERAAPKAQSSLKWGMPFFAVGGVMMCAIGAHKSHVNLILPGPPGTYADPDGLLSGEGKTGQHLKLTTLDELPRPTVNGWLRTAAARAAKGE